MKRKIIVNIHFGLDIYGNVVILMNSLATNYF